MRGGDESTVESLPIHFFTDDSLNAAQAQTAAASVDVFAERIVGQSSGFHAWVASLLPADSHQGSACAAPQPNRWPADARGIKRDPGIRKSPRCMAERLYRTIQDGSPSCHTRACLVRDRCLAWGGKRSATGALLKTWGFLRQGVLSPWPIWRAPHGAAKAGLIRSLEIRRARGGAIDSLAYLGKDLAPGQECTLGISKGGSGSHCPRILARRTKL